MLAGGGGQYSQCRHQTEPNAEEQSGGDGDGWDALKKRTGSVRKDYWRRPKKRSWGGGGGGWKGRMKVGVVFWKLAGQIWCSLNQGCRPRREKGHTNVGPSLEGISPPHVSHDVQEMRGCTFLRKGPRRGPREKQGREGSYKMALKNILPFSAGIHIGEKGKARPLRPSSREGEEVKGNDYEGKVPARREKKGLNSRRKREN